ncbi:L-lysine 2,3-aminomutase [Roseimaritima multifibrata]|uniref:L-lysine 2,3-aminomutase n=1 Tax=Roseimaritima multifibrata TaxID=1930274 RepID=A0A517MJW7_9BACT|nr:EF-P beta-lysylation protein EpmB [Roseimaritima multifibrata]QDS95173.1 L-lysine 2,3-aminomutase [Roseimaritima multifibrata]
MDEILTSDRRSVRAHSDPSIFVSWQQAMKQAIRDGRELCNRLDLPPELASDAAGNAFPVFVPLEFLARMKKGDPDDPLLRQVLGLSAETESAAGFQTDPLAEKDSEPLPGLLHKYHGRALLVTTGACAIHCRYCFRRHFPYAQVPKGKEAWQGAIDYLAQDPSISEVLLSGGDPLTLADSMLGSLVDSLTAIPHIRRLRFHTRLPIAIPQRITSDLITRLRSTSATIWFVVHCNHAAELDEPTLAALERLIDAGIPVLNQAVLLKGVNDSVAALAELSMRLVDHRIQPYYLHQLDRVSGAAHFEVPAETGMDLVEQLRKQLPGYAVPQYVQEIAGDTSKRPF